MSDYDVGYAKPPKHAQFKKGVCPNPHGRGKRRDLTVAEILNKVLNAKTDFRERGKLKKASRIELSIRRFAALATKGDVASAAWLLKMRAHAKKYGDSGPEFRSRKCVSILAGVGLRRLFRATNNPTWK